MPDSANPSKREATAAAIATAAQVLADERGLDGFTMEDLASAAGVSRRTLFNYFPGKIDAVLGTQPEQDPEPLAIFKSGGPTGHLLTDLKELMHIALSSRVVPHTDLARFRRLLKADSRLLKAAHERFESNGAMLVAVILEREGANADPQKALVAVRLIVTVFTIAFDTFIDQPGKAPLAEHFSHAYDTVRTLLDAELVQL